MDRELDRSVVRRRRVRRGVTISALAVGLAVFGLWLPGALRPAVRRAAIRTAVVERGDVEALLQASGTVLPAFERVITSPVEARVLRILRRPGDAVEASQPVVELDVTATRIELERAGEQLASKQSEQRQVALDLERQLDELSSRRESKRLDGELYGYRLEQQRQLFSDGLTSEAALRQAEVEQRKAEVELRQLDEAIDNARRSAIERTGSLAREIAVLEQELAASQRRLEQAEARAERAGVVTWVVSDVGGTVRPGDVLARVADLDRFRLEATVADAYASRVRAGMPVRVTVDGDVLDGHVSAVHPAVEAGAAHFDVALDEPSHPALRPNRRVEVWVVTDVRTDVLRVSRGPFAHAGRHQPVFVVRGDRAFKTEVEIGVAGREHFEIVSGLEAGDEVILSEMTEYEHLDSIGVR